MTLKEFDELFDKHPKLYIVNIDGNGYYDDFEDRIDTAQSPYAALELLGQSENFSGVIFTIAEKDECLTGTLALSGFLKKEYANAKVEAVKYFPDCWFVGVEPVVTTDWEKMWLEENKSKLKLIDKMHDWIKYVSDKYDEDEVELFNLFCHKKLLKKQRTVGTKLGTGGGKC